MYPASCPLSLRIISGSFRMETSAISPSGTERPSAVATGAVLYFFDRIDVFGRILNAEWNGGAIGAFDPTMLSPPIA